MSSKERQKPLNSKHHTHILNKNVCFWTMLFADDRTLWFAIPLIFFRSVRSAFVGFLFSGLPHYLFHKFIWCVSHLWRIWTGVSLFVVVLSTSVSIIMMITIKTKKAEMTWFSFPLLDHLYFFRCPFCYLGNMFF